MPRGYTCPASGKGCRSLSAGASCATPAPTGKSIATGWPPDVAARIGAARERGQLKVRVGRVKEIRKTGNNLLVAFHPRGANTLLHVKADVRINCAGPESNFAFIQEPFVRALRERGMIRPDPLGLGIETTADAEVIGADGATVPGLLALGPIARGAFWEMTAVPELRGLCAAVGRRLASG